MRDLTFKRIDLSKRASPWSSSTDKAFKLQEMPKWYLRWSRFCLKCAKGLLFLDSLLRSPLCPSWDQTHSFSRRCSWHSHSNSLLNAFKIISVSQAIHCVCFWLRMNHQCDGFLGKVLRLSTRVNLAIGVIWPIRCEGFNHYGLGDWVFCCGLWGLWGFSGPFEVAEEKAEGGGGEEGWGGLRKILAFFEEQWPPALARSTCCRRLNMMNCGSPPLFGVLKPIFPRLIGAFRARLLTGTMSEVGWHAGPFPCKPCLVFYFYFFLTT